MRSNTSYILLFFVFNISTLFSQSGNKITFHPTYGSSSLDLTNFYYHTQNSDSIRIESLKFYISEIVFFKNDKIVWKEENSFHLVDASDDKSLQIVLKVPTAISYNKLSFNLGIDSTTNVSGAMGGDLDPTKGMYWTWQSGYVNFKLEGKSSLCETRNNEFHFHLGGYLYPYYALKKINLEVVENKNIDLILDLEKLISSIDLSKQNKIMSPCKEAVDLSEIISTLFRVQQ